MPKCKINGKSITVERGTTIIQAAAELGFDIPHFCYHPGLSVPANCRMCLVEVKGARKLLPALRRYRSERAGYKLFRKHGFETVGEALASELETINRFRAGRGDLCTIERDGVEACGLVCADGVRVKALGRGFDLYSLTDIKRAFRVI